MGQHELFGVVFEGFNLIAGELRSATHGDTIKKPPRIVKPSAVLMMNDLPLIENEGIGRLDGLGFDFGHVNVAHVITTVSAGGFDGTEPTSVGVAGFLIGSLPLLQNTPFPTFGGEPTLIRFVDFTSLTTFVLHGVMLQKLRLNVKDIRRYHHKLQR